MAGRKNRKKRQQAKQTAPSTSTHELVPDEPVLNDPVHGRIVEDRVRMALESDINPLTGCPHTAQYKKLLAERRNLPVYSKMDEFFELFLENQIVIVAGFPGDGKRTQIPQFVCHYYLPSPTGKSNVHERQRTPTNATATRVAEEMDVEAGKHVGYATDFEDMLQPGITLLKYMTDDKLLREAMNDPDLTDYSTIILDQVHERTVATDTLIAHIKSLLKRRSDLKLVLLFATLDALKFQKYFSAGARIMSPILRIPDCRYPVEIFYTQEPQLDYLDAAIRTVGMIHLKEESGDILVFLTGPEEIDDACERIEREFKEFSNGSRDACGPLVCIPWHSSQQWRRVLDDPLASQTVGEPSGRNVILATDTEETLAIVDFCLVSPISKSRAGSRSCLAGWQKFGKCFRLYTERDFAKELEEVDHPDILTSNLAIPILTIVKFGVKDLVNFDWVDTPSPEALMRALEMLNFLAALDGDGNLTTLGAIMAEFPVDPRLAKALIVSPEFKCISNVWVRPSDQKNDADQSKRKFTIFESNHLTLLNVYNKYIESGQDEVWCRNHYLSAQVLGEAHTVRTFDVDIVSTCDPNKLYVACRMTLVCGFFMQVARKEGRPDNYLTVKDNQVVALHPSCGVKDRPEWVLFHEFVLTTRLYIRTVTEVSAEWLLEFAPQYFDLETFPSGEMKRALQRVLDKKMSKVIITGKADRRAKRKEKREALNR
ncbi:P-loop containing nucleoside triphosphate hydrolase protein [Neolentinus lepideus HHB14362 ss-1]|uniref:RNA helicase n=1 Tax=Neolentinus lepideus HHB14362 ss-1 TaxID=1314782 RepID=A0A165P9A4_9AGAM|nr:P-loop containing nucleoside triphosphate hydrolase protein [Neolentinus lepideus HHB14362 ss-1]